MQKARFKIRRKIILAFLFCFLSVFLFALFSFQSHREIGRWLRLVEVADDLVNNLLEVRRFEKNFFLYKHPASLNEALINMIKWGPSPSKPRQPSSIYPRTERNPFFIKLSRVLQEISMPNFREHHFQRNSQIEHINSPTKKKLKNRRGNNLDIAGAWAKEERDTIDHLFLRPLYRSSRR